MEIVVLNLEVPFSRL